MGDEKQKPIQLFTIGHSNRSFEEFLSLLDEFGVQAVADVRRYPGSRKFPHFNRDELERLLNARGIEYFWFEALGGRRHKSGVGDGNTSRNTGLRSQGFRNYADHMITLEFKEACEKLLEIARGFSAAIMCAERFYWRCHRMLLSDYLSARGVIVKHILESGRAKVHTMTAGAVVTEGGEVLYP